MDVAQLKQQLSCFLLYATLMGPTSSIAASVDEQPLPLEDVQRFTMALSQIKSFYVKETKDEELFENAIRGMLAGLDPHSDYLDKTDYSDLISNTAGEFSGLGIEVGMEDGYIKVVSPIDDTPAAQAGVKPGDYIVRLDDKPVKGMSLRQAVKKMRGKRGQKIQLTIVRKNEKEPLKITVVRDTIHINSVKEKLLEDGYGYVRVSHFQEPTASKLKQAISKLKKQSKHKLAGLIIDLRNNPGGLLDSAIEVADTFLDSKKIDAFKQLIVYTEGRIPNSRIDAKATGGDELQGAPIVILINGGSASASEIVAGALQDHRRGIVLGTTSFGKGSVQTVLPLGEDRGVKLTTALYYTPSGRSIQAKGIEPDIIVGNIKVPEPSKQNDWFNDFIKEANLDGHLDAKSSSGKQKIAKQSNSLDNLNSKNLMHTDYQLYEALNLLKGLNISVSNS